MKKTITIAFNFGDEVLLKTDPGKVRIVTGMTIRPSGILYELACGESSSWHQGVEVIAAGKPVKVKGFNIC